MLPLSSQKGTNMNYRYLCLFICIIGLIPMRLYGQQKQSLQSQAIAIFRENCLACHGPTKTAELDLRSRESLLKGGSHGAVVVPKDPQKSRLFQRISAKGALVMPPDKPLSPKQIAIIKNWIAEGAKWNQQSQPDNLFWALKQPKRTTTPTVKATHWARTPIDAFILAKIEAKGLKPAPQADKATLIRRASLDLLGFPPTPKEVEAFQKDTRSDAYERMIDRLLASPHYGERWARHWLDLARYADSEGFKSDEMRPYAWRYRDYVIQAFNADKPYDVFIKEQLAGDEINPDDPSSLIATGFNRHWPDESNAQDLAQRRQEILNDITDTVGSSLLGLTVACARCHDHKYDPVSQKDYYRLQAFFAGVRPQSEIPLLTAQQRSDWQARQKNWNEKTQSLRDELETIETPLRRKLSKERYERFPEDVRQAIDTPSAKRTALQWFLYHKAMPQIEAVYVPSAMAKEMEKAPADLKAKWKGLKATLETYAHLQPAPYAMGQGITDVGSEAPKTFVLAGGSHNKPLDEVQPAFLTALANQTVPSIKSPRSGTTGRRTALANWIASAENPLTARVMVNRVWQHHFGRGLVATSSDFGKTGDTPTHPELLDWLALRFTANSKPNDMNWSLKSLHRLIMNSAVYRQASTTTPALVKADPDNRLLTRYNRRRLEGEAIRDSMLLVSGQLNPKMGGEGVMAELPSAVTTRGYWKETTDMAERNRRSVYLFVKRNMRYPLFEAFDFPDTHEPCSRRVVTTTPSQALLLLNDATTLRLAEAFAQRLLAEHPKDQKAQITQAFHLAYGRPPRYVELQGAEEFLQKQDLINKDSKSTLTDFCHALFNSNEFVYIE